MWKSESEAARLEGDGRQLDRGRRVASPSFPQWDRGTTPYRTEMRRKVGLRAEQFRRLSGWFAPCQPSVPDAKVTTTEEVGENGIQWEFRKRKCGTPYAPYSNRGLCGHFLTIAPQKKL